MSKCLWMKAKLKPQPILQQLPPGMTPGSVAQHGFPLLVLKDFALLLPCSQALPSFFSGKPPKLLFPTQVWLQAPKGARDDRSCGDEHVSCVVYSF